MLFHGHQHPVGLLVITHRADREASEAELGGIDDGAARRSGNCQPDLLDEINASPFGNARDGPSQHIKDVEANDRNVVTHGG